MIMMAIINEYYWSAMPSKNLTALKKKTNLKLEMWANAQPDGRPAEYRWRPLFNAAKFG